MSNRYLREFSYCSGVSGELRRISEPVSPLLEVTVLSDRVLRKDGPALLFERPTGFSTPALTNLLDTAWRWA